MKSAAKTIVRSLIGQHPRSEGSRMVHPLRSLNNENGSAIVIALMLLALLTVMGIWSTRKSNIETLIAGNEVARKQTFYRTESGVIEGGFAIEEAAATDLKAWTPDWLTEKSVAVDMTDPDNWDFDQVGGDDTAVPTTLDGEVGYCAIDKGITSGDSLLMTGATQVRTYAVYSFHDSRDGQSLQEVGYKRRF
jgi:type II secretory pathway pseudopilin PulG